MTKRTVTLYLEAHATLNGPSSETYTMEEVEDILGYEIGDRPLTPEEMEKLSRAVAEMLEENGRVTGWISVRSEQGRG